ncbi:hypothetical protein [Mycobacterium sp. E796]|uniref:hypothetical protein n=1 Tax=Mycobacterium sp. E796 TaxID=1834151 RepID=UPI000800FA5A|nr:hypothetical protein [Mycobacterium sp. E796]OBI45419.1 hypothetical protein A5706_31590 [Mycobacterium sp. E796]
MTAATATRQTFPDYYCDLAGDGIYIEYCVTPPRIPGRPPFVLRYDNGWQTLNFEREQIRSTFVADLGWTLSVTTHELGDAGSVTATILFPTVVMPPTGGEIPVQSMLIIVTHEIPAVVTLPGQRDHYRITALTGRAQKMRLY